MKYRELKFKKFKNKIIKINLVNRKKCCIFVKKIMRKYTDIYSEVVAFKIEKGVLRYIGRMYFYELVKKYNKRLKKDDDMLQGSVKISNTCFAYSKFLFNCNKNEIKLILESEDGWLVEQLYKEFSS